MAAHKENKKIRRVRLCTELMLLSCITAYILMFTFINIRDLDKFCNPDVLADMQVAKRMWEQKTLFPDGWIFGNQLYVIATPVLAALYYGMVGSISSAMVLATGTMTVLILASFVWMLRAFSKDYLTESAACLVLVVSVIAPEGPYSLNLKLFFLQASFYACYLITLFAVLGDYIRSCRCSDCRIPSWIISLLLCFATGMQSLRQTVVMILPIVACELLRILLAFCRSGSIACSISRSSVIRAASYCAANVAGIAAVSLMDIPQNTIYGDMSLPQLEQLGARIQSVGDDLCGITKLEAIMAAEAGVVASGVIVLMIGCVIAAACVCVVRIRRRQEGGLELCWIVCLTGMIGVLLSTVLLNITLRSIYLFTWFPLVALSVLILLTGVSEKIRLGVLLICCCLSAGLFFESYSDYVRYIVYGKEHLVYQQEGYAEEMCDWAMDNGFEYIYGDYWTSAAAISVYSDGKLEAGCWHRPERVFQAEPYNTPQDIYGDQENKKAIYVFTAEDESAGLKKAGEKGAEMNKVAEFGPYSAYTSSIPLMEPYPGI